MSHPGKSVFVFGLYMLVLGAALVLAPNLLLPLFGFALTDEVWIRVMGQLALYLGVYYVWAGYTERREFMALTVAIRLSVPVFLPPSPPPGWCRRCCCYWPCRTCAARCGPGAR